MFSIEVLDVEGPILTLHFLIMFIVYKYITNSICFCFLQNKSTTIQNYLLKYIYKNNFFELINWPNVREKPKKAKKLNFIPR